jgi:outer membrane protein W
MSRSFTKFLVMFVLAGGFALQALAQDDANIIRPITKSGSAAFVFNVTGLGAFGPAAQVIGTVGTQAVAGAGLKYYLSDDLAAKILLAFGTTDDGDDPDSALNTTSMQFGIGAIVEMHFGPLYSTSPYVGGGIKFANASTTNTQGENETVSSGSQITIMAVAGFDWFFTRGIAVGAEWGLGWTSSSTSTETNGQSSENDPSPSSIGLGMNSNAGISGSGSVHAVVYF